MPEKIKNIYVCSNCDAQSIKWSGRCLECGAWGTLALQTVREKESASKDSAVLPAEIIDLEKIEEMNLERIKTGIGEFDRVLGGGIVSGSLILLGGEPGIGKSTIVAQAADMVAKSGALVIYVSGEESAGQIKNRLGRIGCRLKNIKFISETDVEKIVEAARRARPVLLIIDSIQTVYSPQCQGEAGNINQVRAGAVKFLELAKKENIAIMLIGHITKDGVLAGPKSLEHIVDAVAYLEAETAHDYRILRAVKNRFGSVDELGIFEITSAGFVEIKNPSLIFVEGDYGQVTGSVVGAVISGTRPFLMNIQALVTKTIFGYPQRKASGFDLNRLSVLSAVISKRTKVDLTSQDVILNIVGGLKTNDPALDLAVSLAIISSLLNRVIDNKTIVIGEVGLGGEVRNVAKLERRLAEAEKLGFKRAIIPDVKANAGKLEVKKIKNISQLLDI